MQVYSVSQIIEATGRKVAQWCHWGFHWLNPSVRIMTLGSTQSLTEISTRAISCRWRRPVPMADKLCTFVCWLFRYSGSLKFLVPSGPVQACIEISLPFLTNTQIAYNGFRNWCWVIKPHYICCCRIFRSCSKNRVTTCNIHYRRHSVAFLSTWHFWTVSMKVVEFNVWHIVCNVELCCIMCCFRKRKYVFFNLSIYIELVRTETKITLITFSLDPFIKACNELSQHRSVTIIIDILDSPL